MPDAAPVLVSVDKAKVIAYAEHNGPTAAAKHFGLKEGTVKSWLHRWKMRPVATGNATATGDAGETEGIQREGSNGSQTLSDGPRSRRVKGTADEFLGKVRTQLHRMVDKVAGMRITEANIHRIATGLAKAEIAGRVPFGYGGDNSGQAAFGLLNVHVHNARHDSMPALAHEIQAEVMPLPAVSVETEAAEEDESCK